MEQQLNEQEILRRASLEKMREMGINPYPAAEVPVTHSSAAIHAQFSKDPEALNAVCVAGRIMSKRIMGKASFVVIQDSEGRIQAYVSRDEICPLEDKSLYNDVFKKHLDIGDFVAVEGTVFTTKTGETTVRAAKLTALAKALRPLPVVKTDADGKVHDAFADPELRYRQRYVDLVVNEKVKSTFITRSKMMRAMRKNFNDQGWMEVETPILQPTPGGAAARPFVTHHNTLDMPLYLRIANELYLKRLIVGGFEGVYEFAKDFRNEGMDRTHNPEFTVMELYVAYKDYHWMMAFTENLLESMAKEVLGSTDLPSGDNVIALKTPFPRVPILDAIKTHTGLDLIGQSEQELRDSATSIGIESAPEWGSGKIIDEIFGARCEAHYIQPTFITDYPVEMSPLTKAHRDDPRLTERFELMINGKEIANAYSELNDPIEQRARFEQQLALTEKGDDEAMFIDQDFLRALEYGMPPTSGIGIGMDRLAMLFTNQSSIQEVLFFPQMRQEKA